MNSSQAKSDFEWNLEDWQAAEMLVSPIRNEREKALDFLTGKGVAKKSPLVAYLLVSLISDPELETRFHVIQTLGSILTRDKNGEYSSDQVICYIQAYLARINREQVIDLLQVAVQYLSAEHSLIEIFKLCSYAGNILSGIVNDRKTPLPVRQMAIYYCGEVGFLDTITPLRGLVNRIEKRDLVKSTTAVRKRIRDEEDLYSYAVTALEKLEV